MKETINYKKAQEMLLKYNDDVLYLRFTEMVRQFFLENIQSICMAYDVARDDGTVYGDFDEEMWYDDEVMEEFFDRCYQDVSNALYKTWGIKPKEL